MFTRGRWDKTIDVRDFINRNYKPYDGDESFLCGPTPRTKKLWQKCLKLFEKEHKKRRRIGYRCIHGIDDHQPQAGVY